MRLVRFLAAGFATFLIDNGIFYLINEATRQKFLALSVAAVASATFSYIAARRFVFTSAADTSSATLPKFFGLHLGGLLVRYGMIHAAVVLFHLGPTALGVYFAKLAADGVVYSVKYVIQRDFVFRDPA